MVPDMPDDETLLAQLDGMNEEAMMTTTRGEAKPGAPSDPLSAPSDPPSAARGPLSGLRVLDLARVLAGPSCAQILADLGADVVKVEPPGGDSTREMPGAVGTDSPSFNAVNRGKRSIVVNLKSADGPRLVRRLAALGWVADAALGVVLHLTIETRQVNPTVLALENGERVQVMAPVVRGRKGEFRKDLEKYARQGFVRARIDGVVRSLEEPVVLDKRRNHTIEVIIATPAEGPSFGVAPSGTCTWMSRLSKMPCLMPKPAARERT